MGDLGTDFKDFEVGTAHFGRFRRMLRFIF
jgi:hypothetical protein